MSISVAVYNLWRLLGMASLVGFGILLSVIPLAYLLSKANTVSTVHCAHTLTCESGEYCHATHCRTQTATNELTALRDARTALMGEAMTGIRVLKVRTDAL